MRFLLYISLIITTHLSFGRDDDTQIPDQPKNENYTAFTRCFLRAQSLDSAEKYAWLAHNAFMENQSNQDSIVTSAHLLVSILHDLNKNQKALEVILSILMLSEQVGNDTLQARSYEYAGVSHYRVFQIKEAKEMMEKAYEIYSRIDEGKAIKQLRNLAVLKSQFNNHKEALADYRKIYSYYQENPEVDELAITMINMGSVFTSLGLLDSAIYYLEKVTNEGDNLKTSTLQQGYHYLARAHSTGKELIKAFEAAEIAYSLAKELKSTRKIAQATVLLSQISELRNDYKSAYKYRAIGDSILAIEFHENYGNQIAELKIKYEAEQKQRKIDALNYESKAAQNRKVILLVIVLALVIIIALLIAFIIKRNQLYTNELQQAKLRRSKVVQELEFKKNEFTTNSLNVIQKDRLLRDIKANIKGIKEKNNLNPETSKELGQLIRKVDTSFNLEQTWKDFKIHFENVHKDFFTHLLKQYPKISNHELRLCALIKLNLSIKEMAIILNITIQGVKTARYRLRKKFGLQKDESLAQFLISIEENMLEESI